MRKARIKERALELGFSECGIAAATHLAAEQQHFEDVLRKGFHAEMRYLERDPCRRFDPRNYLPHCQSVIVCLFHYPVDYSFDAHYKIARFAHLPDYHVFMKEKLENLARFIHDSEEKASYRITVDTSPVTEKNWAVNAGLGTIGKNTLFRSKNGSFCLIGTILTTLSLIPDHKKEISCGDCELCIKACPTDALHPYQLDCRKCISYRTIEQKDAVLDYTSPQPWIFGCDLCQEVCPHNKERAKLEEKESYFSLFLHLRKEELESLTPEQFKVLFRSSSLERRGYERLSHQIQKSRESFDK